MSIISDETKKKTLEETQTINRPHFDTEADVARKVCKRTCLACACIYNLCVLCARVG